MVRRAKQAKKQSLPKTRAKTVAESRAKSRAKSKSKPKSVARSVSRSKSKLPIWRRYSARMVVGVSFGSMLVLAIVGFIAHYYITEYLDNKADDTKFSKI